MTQQAQHQKKTFPGAGKFDPINSTYEHEIFLQNGRTLKGYSKSLLFAEMQDKIVLLERIVIRLFNNGYLNSDKTKRIDFYLKNLTSPSELVFSLTPTSYTFGNLPKFVFNERINNFLERFYTSLKSQTFVTKDLTDIPITKEQEEIFSLQYRRFKTERELINFITQKRKEGHADGLIMNFYREYKNKFLTF